jgi:hypothetical protein
MRQWLPADQLPIGIPLARLRLRQFDLRFGNDMTQFNCISQFIKQSGASYG